jgi:hypothetical protein
MLNSAAAAAAPAARHAWQPLAPTPEARPVRGFAPARRLRAGLAPRAASQKGGPDFNRAAEQAQDFARRTSESAKDWVRQQELDKKAAAAYEDAQQQLRTG